MEVLQNGFAKFAITKPHEISVPLTNGTKNLFANGTTNLLNLIAESTEDLSNMDPSRAFVNRVKRLIVKVLLLHQFIHQHSVFLLILFRDFLFLSVDGILINTTRSSHN
jgi:hypothetical protein